MKTADFTLLYYILNDKRQKCNLKHLNLSCMFLGLIWESATPLHMDYKIILFSETSSETQSELS